MVLGVGVAGRSAVVEVDAGTLRPMVAVSVVHMAEEEVAGVVVHDDTQEEADIPDIQGRHTQVAGNLTALEDTPSAPRAVEPSEAVGDSS